MEDTMLIYRDSCLKLLKLYDATWKITKVVLFNQNNAPVKKSLAAMIISWFIGNKSLILRLFKRLKQ